MTKKGLTQLILSVLLISAFGPITYVAKSADTSTATTATPSPTATATPSPNRCATQGVVNRPDWDSIGWTEYCTGNQIFDITFVIKDGKRVRVVGTGSSVSASDVPSPTASTTTPTPTQTATSTPTKTETTTSTTTSTTTPSTPALVVNCLSAGATVTRLDWDSVNWTEICNSSQIFDFFLVIQGGKKLRVVGTGRSVSVSDVPSELTTTTAATTTTTKTETSTATTTKTETSTATSLTPITCLTRGAIVSRPDWDSGNWTEICKPPQTFDFILIIKGGIKLRVSGGPSGVSISDYYYPSEIKQLTTTQSDTRTVTTQSDTRTVTSQSTETKYTQLVITSVPDLKTRTAETALLINTYEQSDKEKALTVITKSTKNVVMTVSTEIPGVTVLLTATKKNSKPITFQRTTNDKGLANVTTRLPLSGYLITFSINGVKIDSDPIKDVRGKI